MKRWETGLERWFAEGPGCAGVASDARLGLVAHAASIDSAGLHALERFAEPSSGPSVVRLFAPEHGLWGHEQDMESVGAASEPLTGLPVVSLYGTDFASLRPGPETMVGLDAILFDLQDVGSRYYTYVYTLSFVMEAARDAGIPVVVLDRPNPIGGSAVEGPVLHEGFESFVGRYPIPVRHGMTAGELGELFNREFAIGADLRVVEMRGWRRDAAFESGGLPWVAPSPNMPSLATARVYPGGCLIEGTNLSEARGTTLPFELVGAPWLDARELAVAMRRHELPGVAFRAASFRPETRKHAGQPCNGVQLLITDPRRIRAFETYLVLLQEIRRQDPSALEWRTEVYEFVSDRLAIDLLLGRADLREMLENDAALDEMVATWQADLDAFLELRRRYLRYS